MGEVVGERKGHGQVHAGDGEGSDEVALEEGPLVLAHPYQAGQVVGQVHEGVRFDAVSLGQLAGPAHGLAPHLLGPPPAPVGGALGGDKCDDAVEDGQRTLGGGTGGDGAGLGLGRGGGRLGREGAVATGPIVGMVVQEGGGVVGEEGGGLGGGSRAS